jgi:PIN domain nuclease of toxin-antitoxin system
MKYLIDTHVLIWSLCDKDKISKKAAEILKDSHSKIFVSPISLLEIAIKLNLGKLIELTVPFSEVVSGIQLLGFEMLPVKNEHTETYTNFTFNSEHRDPFDRYLIAAAFYENMSVITCDKKFQHYKVVLSIIW